MATISEMLAEMGDSIVNWARPEGWPVAPTSSWPLAKFEHAFLIAVGYLVFVGLGVLIMPHLPTIKGLYPFKFIYNMLQVMLCSYMAIEAGIRAYDAGYSLIPCNTFNHMQPPIGFILYVFYLSKILDFLDTVFIIAEKRWKQLSFLHVYHHFSIFLFYWLNVNVGYDGDVFLTIVLNGFIHTVMYTYYFVSLHTKEIWWKSALTMCQMVQFICMNAQALYLIFSNCTNYPRNIIVAYLFYIMTLLGLFAHFFVMSYMKSGKEKKGSSKSNKKDS